MQLDPNIQQTRASNPQTSVWVGASAGTGKTKVLTDRVLRLLLPQQDGRKGADPERVLCITFTKAAAGEMKNRLLNKLSDWVVMEKEELSASLESLLGYIPDDKVCEAARHLFAKVVDLPQGMNIQTIHAFCQSILQRFPIEAGLHPDFKAIDENQAQLILAKIQDDLLSSDDDKIFKDAVDQIIMIKNEEQFQNILVDITNERLYLREMYKNNKGLGGFVANLYRFLNISPEDNFETATHRLLDGQELNQKIKTMMPFLSQGGADDKKALDKIQNFFIFEKQNLQMAYDLVKDAFLTTMGGIRKNCPIKKVVQEHPESKILFLEIAEDILEIQETLKKIQLKNFTVSFAVIADRIISAYEAEKKRTGLVDYDDQIHLTAKLLNESHNAPWILYKLDGGFDHVLVDEAQDTNPIQWKVISALCSEFFSGQGREEQSDRTLFVVGDKKQSIYSFQKADPEHFLNMQDFFASKIKDSQKKYEAVDLDISFRSSQPILQVVDMVFNHAEHNKGVIFDDDKIQHFSFYQSHFGLVELASFIQPVTEKEEDTGWMLPTKIQEEESSEYKLAKAIASRISDWIKNKTVLRNKNRPISPDDIMILVRDRGPLYKEIARQIAAYGITFAGRDRVALNQDLLIKDMMAFAQFALLPSDDFSLACLLKSPFINLQSENDIFDLCYKRPDTVWQSLQENKKFVAIKLYLQNLIEIAAQDKVYEFFDFILRSPCPSGFSSGLKACLARRGDEIHDVLDIFMDFILRFEMDHPPNLQIFCDWALQNTADQKRENEESSGGVRLMTIHGAKGLQAPIVIIPEIVKTKDKANKGSQKEGFLYQAEKDNILLWSPKKEFDIDVVMQAKEHAKKLQQQESRRLLYVAMTRAEECLYFMAALPAEKEGKSESIKSWYQVVEDAVQVTAKNDHQWKLKTDAQIGSVSFDTILQFSNEGTAAANDKKQYEDKKREETFQLPEWSVQHAKIEKRLVRPLSPSKLDDLQSEKNAPSLSPVAQRGQNRFRRGILIHKLLQYLPAIKTEKYFETALRFLEQHAKDIGEAQRTDIAHEVVKVLNHPDLAPAFSPSSRAEASITGVLKDGTLLSGQVDRLVVLPDKVLIIDFKTNRPSPDFAADVPKAYLKQMAAYEAVLKAIYPDKAMQTALLWTDKPHFMILSSEQLDPYRPAL